MEEVKLRRTLGTLRPLPTDVVVHVATFLPLRSVVHSMALVSVGLRQHLFAMGASSNYFERLLVHTPPNQKPKLATKVPTMTSNRKLTPSRL